MVLQQAHLHDALEEALADAAGRDPRVASVASTRRDPREALRADAERLGGDPAEPAASSTREVCEEIRASLDVVPVSVLGWVYVIEGSYNGGRFIGMNLARQEAFSDGAGLMALNPHGDEQPQRWAAFKQAMDAADLSEPERDAIVEAARAMFLGVSAMSTEIAER
jgi:heme oxygenase